MTEKRQICVNGHDTFIVGRDSSYRCLECKRLAAQAARDAREAAEKAVRTAELVQARAAADRRHAHERELALAAGGTVAKEARWLELWERSPGVCQWPLDDGRPGACMRRTANVYCSVHNRQLDRELQKRKENEHV